MEKWYCMQRKQVKSEYFLSSLIQVKNRKQIRKSENENIDPTKIVLIGLVKSCTTFSSNYNQDSKLVGPSLQQSVEFLYEFAHFPAFEINANKLHDRRRHVFIAFRNSVKNRVCKRDGKV